MSLNLDAVRMLPDSVTYQVLGEPKTQGSKSAFVNRATGKAVMRESAGMPLRNWRLSIAERSNEVLMDYRYNTQFTGPLGAVIEFRLLRAKSRKLDVWSPQRYDLDKLVRAVFDGIVQGGLVKDDRLFCTLTASKKLESTDNPWTGCNITIFQLFE